MTPPRHPQAGDYVTIVTHKRQLTRAYVCETVDQVTEAKKRTGLPWVTPEMLVESERGIWWAIGLDGPEVEALRAATALL